MSDLNANCKVFKSSQSNDLIRKNKLNATIECIGHMITPDCIQMYAVSHNIIITVVSWPSTHSRISAQVPHFKGSM